MTTPKEATERLEGVLDEADQKRKEAQAMQSLLGRPEWTILLEYCNQMTNVYMNQMISPIEGREPDSHIHYLRGLVKGIETVKGLPQQVIGIYNREQAAAQAAAERANAGSADNPEMRMSPEPEETH